MKELEVLKVELEKMEVALAKTNPTDYKRYATVLQGYITVNNTVAQLEAFEKQRAEEEARRAANEQAMKEAEEEIRAEEEAKVAKRVKVETEEQ